jgi:flavin-dependent dehydrogenase
MTHHVDVAIVGGGPGGSTAAAVLKQRRPDLKVLVIEREVFPRDHVGESQLPEVSTILNEIGVWDKVEAAGFPIKIGATYRWGSTKDLWDFEFLPSGQFMEEARPAKYEGQRQATAFQVDRAIYDEILLNHAQELGAEVLQAARVTGVHHSEGAIAGLTLEDGRRVEAKTYIDASGGSAILRRSLGVEVEIPTKLQNIAIWDYWQNADWAVEIGVGGTRIQIMSLGYGWIWFIPLGPTRTSIGLVIPAQYYRDSGKKPHELYEEAVSSEPKIASLLKNASSEGRLATTKDWSFVSQQWVGPNWFLVGEAGGFADPILSAGLTLTHSSAREAAYTILALEKGEHDPHWLKENYEQTQMTRVRQHMRFAEFWYSTNRHFSDLKEHCAEIAKDAGLLLNADAAFQWLGTGGFARGSTVYGTAGLAGYSLESVKQLTQQFTETSATWQIGQNNIFRMNVAGARRGKVAVYADGEIHVEDAILREGKELPFSGFYAAVISVLHQCRTAPEIAEGFRRFFHENAWMDDVNDGIRCSFHTLEAMIANGWVDAEYDPSLPTLAFLMPQETACIHPNRDSVWGVRPSIAEVLEPQRT